MPIKAILFDINETVLDLAPLRPKFGQYLGAQSHMDTWFAMLLHASTVCLATHTQTDFKSLSHAALLSLAGRLNISLTTQQIEDLLRSFANLPAHNDVVPALMRLQKAGFQLVAFSNSSQRLLDEQLNNAGVSTLFDRVISVQTAHTFKPAAEAYHFAATALGLHVHEICLVATHDWDTHGALSAGLCSAFIDRFHAPYNALYKKPRICADSMDEIAVQLMSQKPQYGFSDNS